MPNGLCWLLTTFSGYSGASLGGEEAVLEEDPSDHMVPLVLFFLLLLLSFLGSLWCSASKANE